MKLKLREDSKDITIFGIFSFIWLILVAIVVVNVSAFINGESFTAN